MDARDKTTLFHIVRANGDEGVSQEDFVKDVIVDGYLGKTLSLEIMKIRKGRFVGQRKLLGEKSWLIDGCRRYETDVGEDNFESVTYSVRLIKGTWFVGGGGKGSNKFENCD